MADRTLEGPPPYAQTGALEGRQIRKTFGGVTALDDVDFVLHHGEIHGLVGQNGAGKSTLVKVLTGVHQPDSGKILVDGRQATYRTPREARNFGIAMVFQEFSLIPTLSVAQNVFLVHEPRTAMRLVDDRAAEDETRSILAALAVEVDPRARVGSLPVGSQQLVEIAKAVSWSPTILVLDEPTASLTYGEIETLFSVLRRLRDQGVSIIYISHHLDEVMAVCDAITVLRDGRVALAGGTAGLAVADLVAAMTGRAIEAQRTAGAVPAREGTPVLEVRDWCLGTRLQGIDLAVHEGEVVGIAGLLGSGRTSLVRSLMGLEPGVTGQLLVDGRSRTIRDPADAVAAGLAVVPEDRRRDGIVAGQSVESNLLLSTWTRLTRFGLLDDRAARFRTSELIERLAIRTAGPGQPVEALSGGNQQKVVVGRALALEPRALLLDDPTAGIDIKSRRELLEQLRTFADGGRAIVLVSSELDELGAVCDRVAILRRGAIARVLDRARGDDLSGSALLAAIHEDQPQGTAPAA